MSRSHQVPVDGRLTHLPVFNSTNGQTRPIQEFLEAGGDGLTMGAAAIVVKEDDGGIFYPLIGGGNPIPRSAASGCKAKARTQLLLVRQFVQGFDVQGLKTINRPAFRPPASLAGLLELEAGKRRWRPERWPVY